MDPIPGKLGETRRNRLVSGFNAGYLTNTILLVCEYPPTSNLQK